MNVGKYVTLIFSVVIIAVVVVMAYTIGGDIVVSTVDSMDVNSTSGNPFWSSLSMAGVDDDGSMKANGGLIGSLGILALGIIILGFIVGAVYMLSKVGRN